MNVFKLKMKDSTAFAALGKLDKGALQLKKLVKAVSGRESELRYTGTPDRPAMEVRVSEGRGPESELDLADQINELLRLFCSAVVYYREHSPSILGDITTVWHSVDLPDDVGARFEGNTLLINAKLGGCSRIRALRVFMCAVQPLAISGIVVPSPPKSHEWRKYLRSELREGKVYVELSGAVIGHSQRPGGLKLSGGAKGTKLSATPDVVLTLMSGFATGRLGIATARPDRDPVFGDVRFALHEWKWLVA